MSPHRRRRGPAVALAAALTGLALAACNEVETPTEEGYQPASLSEPDRSGVKTVTLTAEAAERIGLRTEKVTRIGPHLTVPYQALIYDGRGVPWVYTEVSRLDYRRVKVAVDRTDAERALLTSGPPPGTQVVTQGSTQVFGAELEMAGKH